MTLAGGGQRFLGLWPSSGRRRAAPGAELIVGVEAVLVGIWSSNSRSRLSCSPASSASGANERRCHSHGPSLSSASTVARSVALVACEPIRRVARIELGADAIARHLGHDAGRRDRGADRVAVDDRPLRQVDVAQAERVDDQVVGLLRHAAQRIGHGSLVACRMLMRSITSTSTQPTPTDRHDPGSARRAPRPARGRTLLSRRPLIRWRSGRMTAAATTGPPAIPARPRRCRQCRSKPASRSSRSWRMERRAGDGAAHGPAPDDRSHHEIGHPVSGARAGWRTCRRGRAGSRAGRGGRRRAGPPRSSPRVARAP